MNIIETLFNLAPRLAETAKPGPGHVMICCPFHGEKTPSCSVSTEKPVYFCHGCKSAGHIAQILRQLGMSNSAIDIILPKSTRDAFQKETLSAKIRKGKDPFRGDYVLPEEALDTYRLCPTSLLRAGFEKQTLRHFEVGYDSKNFRITFPLRDVFGNLVGISGRAAIEGMEPRYKIYDRELKEREDLNVPDNYTMEQVKQAVLWHGHVVRPLFFKNYSSDFMVITEGFKACMWTWQVGYEDVVALVGSYLSDVHAELIARAVRRVVLFLDNNKAGFKGTIISAEKLVKKGVEVRCAVYPPDEYNDLDEPVPYEQPDSLTPDQLYYAIDDHIPYVKWRSTHEVIEPLKFRPKRFAAY